MRSMVVARKLKDIAAAQQSEITTLTAELTRLERATFPHFPEAAGGLFGGGGRRAAGPDERAPAARG